MELSLICFKPGQLGPIQISGVGLSVNMDNINTGNMYVTESHWSFKAWKRTLRECRYRAYQCRTFLEKWLWV